MGGGGAPPPPPRGGGGGGEDATPGAEGKVLRHEAAEGRDRKAVDPPHRGGPVHSGRGGEAGSVRSVEFVDEGEVRRAVGDLESEDLAEGDEQVGVQLRVVCARCGGGGRVNVEEEGEGEEVELVVGVREVVAECADKGFSGDGGTDGEVTLPQQGGVVGVGVRVEDLCEQRDDCAREEGDPGSSAPDLDEGLHDAPVLLLVVHGCAWRWMEAGRDEVVYPVEEEGEGERRDEVRRREVRHGRRQARRGCRHRRARPYCGRCCLGGVGGGGHDPASEVSRCGPRRSEGEAAGSLGGRAQEPDCRRAVHAPGSLYAVKSVRERRDDGAEVDCV